MWVGIISPQMYRFSTIAAKVRSKDDLPHVKDATPWVSGIKL